MEIQTHGYITHLCIEMFRVPDPSLAAAGEGWARDNFMLETPFVENTAGNLFCSPVVSFSQVTTVRFGVKI